jgi:hypothetical protein
VVISSVTRATGGEWYRLSFRRPVTLESIRVLALSAGVKLHEVKFHTWSGGAYYIGDLTPSRTFYAGDSVGSSYFSNERIQAIDIRAESMGGYADLQVRVVSDDDQPVMDVNRF